MAQTSVRVRTVQDACVAVGWAGHRTLTVDRPEQAGGMGLGFNGGELLLLVCDKLPVQMNWACCLFPCSHGSG